MIDKAYLAEAFKQLDLLNEEDYNLSTDSSAIEDAIDMLDKNDKIMSMDIIDDEADNEEELQDSYNGKVILDCCVCHSKLYKDKEDVVIDDETNLANVGEECPFCYTNDGYYIIGQVASFNDEEPEIEETEEEVIETEEPVEEEETEGFDESLNQIRDKSVNESEEGKKLFTEYKILVDGRTYEISHTKQRADEIVPILKDMYPDSEIEAKPYKHYASGIERKRLERQIADQLKEYGVNEPVNESIQEIEIETDTDKIKIESEPKEESGETEDVLAPVSPETEHQIENNSSDEIDVPIDEFDEETFDELGESFLKNTYDNVVSYKTESIKEQDGNKLVVEGLIKFNSGNTKKTTFIFESKDITKTGRVRFIGENCQLSRGKKSFTVAGKVNEGKFISESLNYNYRAKDVNGKSARMYGTVRTNK